MARKVSGALRCRYGPLQIAGPKLMLPTRGPQTDQRKIHQGCLQLTIPVPALAPAAQRTNDRETSSASALQFKLLTRRKLSLRNATGQLSLPTGRIHLELPLTEGFSGRFKRGFLLTSGELLTPLATGYHAN